MVMVLAVANIIVSVLPLLIAANLPALQIPRAHLPPKDSPCVCWILGRHRLRRNRGPIPWNGNLLPESTSRVSYHRPPDRRCNHVHHETNSTAE